MKKLLIVLSALSTSFAFAKVETGHAFEEAARIDGTDVNAMSVCLEGSRLYAGAGDWLYVFDVAKAREPKLLGKVRGLGGVRQIAVQKGMAYVSTREYGLWIVDATNVRRPRIRSRFDCCELATGVDVAGDVCFLGQRQNGVEFIDVSDPDNPRHIAMRKTDESQSVKYRDGYLYSGEWGSAFVTVFDARDMANIREIAKPELYGYGDGVWLQGRYLYAATGHHAKHRKVTGGVVTEEMKRFGGPAEGGGMGHGLDIFDVADPAKPRRVGRADYPPFYARGLDMWTPRTSGDLLVASQTHNGVFAVDISDKTNPRVLDRWTCPNAKHPEWPSDCVGSVAIGDGVVYAAVKGAGFFMIPCARAKPETFDPGALPKNASFREPYPVDTAAWHVWKPKDVGQARGVAVKGDVVYAACGDAGLYALQILPDNGGLKELGRLSGHDHVFDVKVDGDRLYTAEGADGFGVYSLKKGATAFEPVARLPFITPRQHLALYVQPAAPGWLFCSDRHGVDLFDIHKLPVFKHALHMGGCPGWDKYLQDRAVAGGRYIAYNSANTSLQWADLQAKPMPVRTVDTKVNRLYLSSSVCAFRDDLTLGSAGGSFVLLKPNEGDPEDGGKWTFNPLPPAFPGKDGHRGFTGIPRSDGTRVIFTNRIHRRAALYDFTDVKSPKLLGAWKLSGNPDIADFHDGKVVIPCGYAGVLLQK